MDRYLLGSHSSSCVGLPSARHLDIVAVTSHPSPPPKMKAIDHASRPHGAADERHFVLPALMQPLLGRTDGLPIRVYRVTFGEGGPNQLAQTRRRPSALRTQWYVRRRRPRGQRAPAPLGRRGCDRPRRRALARRGPWDSGRAPRYQRGGGDDLAGVLGLGVAHSPFHEVLHERDL